MNCYSHRFKFLLFPVVVLLLTSLISACSTAFPISQPTTTATLEGEVTPLPTSTTLPATPLPPTITPSPTQAVEDFIESDIANEGLFLIAMKDGQFDHLFVYHPLNFSLTRFTSGEFDFAEPEVSPNGELVAYCANQTGNWEIYTLNLLTGVQVQVTQAQSYACAPTWSPDGQWLAYETVTNGKLVIQIQSTIDLTQSPLNLTKDTYNSFDPAWSPEGRQIAFATDRKGRSQIWLADLNATEDRLSPLISSTDANFASPDWSQDGSSLAWSRITEQSIIERQNLAEESQETVILGMGSQPVWAFNESISTLLRTPNGYELVSYHNDPNLLLFPPIHLPGVVTSLTWQPGAVVSNMRAYIANFTQLEPAPFFEEEISTSDAVNGLFTRKAINDLQAPENFLSDTINDRFNAMRENLETELGWDFLGILQNAIVSIPDELITDIRGNWLYTGRAISVNLDPLDAGWMAISREDYIGRAYWRVWLKCIRQDGTCGIPLKQPVWDFSARSNGELAGYENGGDMGAMPEGYWLDFTAFARGYGWERMPAGSNWRNYFPATNISIFALTDGLTWKQAMLQLYTPEELAEVLE